jgi:hypothetical protein
MTLTDIGTEIKAKNKLRALTLTWLFKEIRHNQRVMPFSKLITKRSRKEVDDFQGNLKGDLHGKLFTPILSFDHFWRHVTFVPMGDAERQKVQRDFIKIVVAVDFN